MRSSNFHKSKTIEDSKKETCNSHTNPEGMNQIDYFTPKDIVTKFSKYLNKNELDEILQFQEIYYCGKYLKNKQQMMKIEWNSNLMSSSLLRSNTFTNEDDKIINLKS